MKYVGSKAKHTKWLIPIIAKWLREKNLSTYVEPFVGAANVIVKVPSEIDGRKIKRIGSDINPYIIAFLKRLQKEGTDWLPKDSSEFTEKDYNYVRTHRNEFHPSYVGYVGFFLSFGSKFFGGWRRSDSVEGKDVARAYNQAKALCKFMDGYLEFKTLCFKKSDPSSSLIYCDPPYEGTTGYENPGPSFNHQEFWEWCGCQENILVSSYQAPKGWKVLYELGVSSSLDLDTGGRQSIERLFTKA